MSQMFLFEKLFILVFYLIVFSLSLNTIMLYDGKSANWKLTFAKWHAFGVFFCCYVCLIFLAEVGSNFYKSSPWEYSTPTSRVENDTWRIGWKFFAMSKKKPLKERNDHLISSPSYQTGQRKWYIFYLRPRSENVVYQVLMNLEYNVFFPTITSLRIWKNRQKKKIKTPLFLITYSFIRKHSV